MATRPPRKTKAKVILFAYPKEPQVLPLDELLPPEGGDDDGHPYMIPMVVITPEIAEAFLGRVAQTDNRTERKRNSTAFTLAIVMGWFRRTHQGVAFDVQGRMFDGQHRMSALLKAARRKPDASIVVDVHYNQPVENAPALDGGAKRTAEDHLKVAGIRGARPAASLLRLHYLVEQTAGQIANFKGVRPLQPHEVVERGHEHAEGLAQSWAAVYPLRAVPNLGRNLNAAAVFHYLTLRKWPDAPVEDFITGLADTDWDSRDDPRKSFHQWCGTADRRNNIDVRHYLANLTITFNAWVHGVKGAPGKWRPTKPLPELDIPEDADTARRARHG